MIEIIVDNFAGWGGVSKGIEMAIGRAVDIAINHNPIAIAMHRANHPGTKHYCEDVWEVNPVEAAAGRPVGFVWFSPDCTHHSKARGGKPKDKNIRGLAWVCLRWAATVKPRVMALENVEEFLSWGPLLPNGQPDPKKKGYTFKSFVKALRRHGYKVEWRELRACDYGAPTTRKRLFMMMRRDGKQIVWPKPTHGHPDSPEVKAGKLKPWKVAAEIIDFSKACPSIFDTPKEIYHKHGIKAIRPLANNTIRRIAAGLNKFFINNPEPFIIRVNYSRSKHHYCNSINEPLPTITSTNGWGVVAPFLTQYHSYKGDSVRGQTVNKPILTIDTSNRYGLINSFISKYYGSGGSGSAINEPLHTITSKDRNALITSHLVKMKGTNIGHQINEPLQTITAGGLHFGEVRTFLTNINSQQELGHWPEIRDILNKFCSFNIADDEILLFQIDGEYWFISDIGMRMLEPRELFSAQGFPEGYIIDRDDTGKLYSKKAQVAGCGNSVSPVIPAAIIRANLPEFCVGYEDSEQVTRVM